MQRTHDALDAELCGRPRELGDGFAVVDFVATPRMRADEHDLVHGGFVFGLADHAAMLAVNHPNVVLGSATVRFERPVVVGDRLTARADVRSAEGNKQQVEVEVDRDGAVVMRAQLTCFTPARHVLDRAPEANR
jgi:uncharacterized protein (TIGR00369 family)